MVSSGAVRRLSEKLYKLYGLHQEALGYYTVTRVRRTKPGYTIDVPKKETLYAVIFIDHKRPHAIVDPYSSDVLKASLDKLYDYAVTLHRLARRLGEPGMAIVHSPTFWPLPIHKQSRGVTTVMFPALWFDNPYDAARAAIRLARKYGMHVIPVEVGEAVATRHGERAKAEIMLDVLAKIVQDVYGKHGNYYVVVHPKSFLDPRPLAVFEAEELPPTVVIEGGVAASGGRTIGRGNANSDVLASDGAWDVVVINAKTGEYKNAKAKVDDGKLIIEVKSKD